VTLSVVMDGRTEEMRARWVIGADGAASTVRRLQTNSSFTTQTVAGESSKRGWRACAGSLPIRNSFCSD